VFGLPAGADVNPPRAEPQEGVSQARSIDPLLQRINPGGCFRRLSARGEQAKPL
jgi:hypothetical protein